MSIIARPRPHVNLDIIPDDGPAFEPESPAPSDEESLWAAETSPFADEAYDVEPEPDFDAMAFESATMGAIEDYLIDAELADWLSRTSPVGHPA